MFRLRFISYLIVSCVLITTLISATPGGVTRLSAHPPELGFFSKIPGAVTCPSISNRQAYHSCSYGPGETSLVSIASDGSQADSWSYRSSISADGRYVAFESVAENLFDGHLVVRRQIYVRDLKLNLTRLVSQNNDKEPGNGESIRPSISGDGRFIVFESAATNLGADNGERHIYVRDLWDEKTILVSVSSNQTNPGDDESVQPSISVDGRFVTFASDATNLVPDDNNGLRDIFLRDLIDERTIRVSLNSDGSEILENLQMIMSNPSVSEYGAFVTFSSTARIDNDTDGRSQIYVRDVSQGRTILVSVTPDGSFGNDRSGTSSISSCGRYVAFSSRAEDLVDFVHLPGTRYNIFLRDLEKQETILVSAKDGTKDIQGNGPSVLPAISAEGRFVVFHSLSSNLVDGDTNDKEDVFVRDVHNHRTRRVSVDSQGNQVDGTSRLPSISHHGCVVAFMSTAENLVPNDENGWHDIFIHACLGSAEFDASPSRGPVPLTVNFTDLSLGEFNECLWKFGDGNSSDQCNPIHTYTTTGEYTVSLTVGGLCGDQQETKHGWIIVDDAPVSADFIASPKSGTAPLDVQFTNLSTGNSIICHWAFGDGNSISDPSCQDLTHTYTSAGTFNVTLIADGPGGEDDKEEFIHVSLTDEAPQITSPDSTTLAVGVTTSFTVTATGIPTPSLAVSDALPGGVSFTNMGDGTATISGTPAVGSEGEYPLTITASNGVDPDAEQSFTLTVVEAAAVQAPQITSPDNTTFAIGVPGSFTVTTTGIPTVSLAVSGVMPGGVTFTNTGDGTATLSGTPTVGSEGDYPLTITASNGVDPDDTQQFILRVSEDAGSTLFLPLFLR
jgi:PKD repeat protein